MALDRSGFVVTGGQLGDASRPPETSVRGVFAIGDVRSGAVKRVAAAVGEGAQVIAMLPVHPAETSSQPATGLALGSV